MRWGDPRCQLHRGHIRPWFELRLGCDTVPDSTTEPVFDRVLLKHGERLLLRTVCSLASCLSIRRVAKSEWKRSVRRIQCLRNYDSGIGPNVLCNLPCWHNVAFRRLSTARVGRRRVQFPNRKHALRKCVVYPGRYWRKLLPPSGSVLLTLLSIRRVEKAWPDFCLAVWWGL